jgi:hypothetical protein
MGGLDMIITIKIDDNSAKMLLSTISRTLKSVGVRKLGQKDVLKVTLNFDNEELIIQNDEIFVDTGERDFWGEFPRFYIDNKENPAWRIIQKENDLTPIEINSIINDILIVTDEVKLRFEKEDREITLDVGIIFMLSNNMHIVIQLTDFFPIMKFTYGENDMQDKELDNILYQWRMKMGLEQLVYAKRTIQNLATAISAA